MVPGLEFEEIDNQLGVTPPDTGDVLATIAVSVGGTLAINTPSFFSDPKDAQTQCGSGARPEHVSYELELTGRSILSVRAELTTEGSVTDLDITGVQGSCVVSVDSSVKPYDDFEVRVRITTACTIGVTGGEYQTSLDDGRTWSRVLALGTATSITIADGNVKFNLAAGDFDIGDFWTATAIGPDFDDNALDAALDALSLTSNDFDIIYVDGPLTAAKIAVMDTAAKSMSNLGREVICVGSFRWPEVDETEQEYLAAFQAAFDATVATHCCIFAGSIEAQSPISLRRLKRRPAFDAVVAMVNSRPGQDLAEKGTQVRPAAVRIVDDQNNYKHHDELKQPGLDDARASTYRSWLRSPGAYINNARLLSTPGSDFTYSQHRRVMNAAKRLVRDELERFTSADFFANIKNGRIREEDAADIDLNVNAKLAQLTASGDATLATFRLSRVDNAISTFTLKGKLRVIPKIYPKLFEVEAGFQNPALILTPGG
jgi:hypothetical protein